MERTERVISPLQLVHYRENWVLDAWCHLRNELRSFGLEAIEDVQIAQELATEVSQEDMREHFQSGYGIFAGKSWRINIRPLVLDFMDEHSQRPEQSSRPKRLRGMAGPGDTRPDPGEEDSKIAV